MLLQAFPKCLPMRICCGLVESKCPSSFSKELDHFRNWDGFVMTLQPFTAQEYLLPFEGYIDVVSYALTRKEGEFVSVPDGIEQPRDTETGPKFVFEII